MLFCFDPNNFWNVKEQTISSYNAYLKQLVVESEHNS